LLHEMYSLGNDPYENVPLKQLKSFLNSGQRMDQPTYANTEMFVLS
jgi:hypothetical protein